MEKILVILDGLGDLPCKELNFKTPLEAANLPNLNLLANRGKLGYMYPISEGFAPESDSPILAMLGNDPYISKRGYFEAIGANLKLRRGDLALRTNFATIDNLKSKKILDRRAGRTLTTKEAEMLAKNINKKIKLPAKFEFKPTIQHRGVLVLRGGFSDNITSTDTYERAENKIIIKENLEWSKPLDDEENTEYTVNLINSFVDQSFKVLNNHPINEIRKKKGLMPANIILTRDANIEIPNLIKFRKSMAIVNMPLEKGITKSSGMDVYFCDYPEMKSYDVYDNLNEGLQKMIKFCIKIIKKKHKKYNFCYVHIKETDLPGHDNKPIIKKDFLEKIDKSLFSFLAVYVEKNNTKIIVTGDHSTPCKMKTHTSDPVPVLVYDPDQEPDNCKAFNEKEARNGSLGKIYAKQLLKKARFV